MTRLSVDRQQEDSTGEGTKNEKRKTKNEELERKTENAERSTENAEQNAEPRVGEDRRLR